MITRPREDARAVVEELAARGIDSMVEPVLEIVPLATGDLDLDGVQAVLVTSANGARALGATSQRDIPVLAVGDATAAAARDAGFAAVAVAGGDVAALAALAAERCNPGAGPLVHVSGSAVAGDLAGRLAARGFTVRREVLYEARAASALSRDATAALSGGDVDAVLLYSPRTAEAFVALVRRAGLVAGLRRARALCLSGAVADAARGIAWREVCVAARPDQTVLLDLVGR